jgi:polyferredoxin
LIGAGSVFLAFVFISYFVEPRDLFSRLVSFDVVTAGGFAGAVVTLIAFADFVFLRQKFCTTVCPYGYLQGILGDDNTLVVRYDDPDNICIECTKCVRVCHMGIDIRDTPYQIECIHCGECVDACKLIMGKFGKDTLIHYAWGEKGEVFGAKKGKWYQRLGLRDAKRFAVIAIILVYGSSLAIALTLRHNVLVYIAADRGTLYRVDAERVYNTFRMTLANRGNSDAVVTLSITGLPDAAISLGPNEIALKAGEELKQEFEISVPSRSLSEQVNHFEITSSVRPDDKTDIHKQTFIVPVETK